MSLNAPPPFSCCRFPGALSYRAVTPQRLREITQRFQQLRVALIGDICLDRYFEIDPARQEISIETNLPVHNVTRVRCQPGGAGTILNNLVALGVNTIYPAAILGDDGEGFELRRALQRLRGVEVGFLVQSPERRTFTYSKPLLMHIGRGPEELNRLDIKNWSETPKALQDEIARSVRALASEVDAIILLDQVDIADTGVITSTVLDAVAEVARARPELLILADSRRSLRSFPKISYKMNASEMALYFGRGGSLSPTQVRERIGQLARETGKHVFVSMSQHGMTAAHAGVIEQAPALPLRGEIDIVGAGDAVTANITAALSAGATLRETLQLAQLAASIVIHQLGTTGTANPEQLEALLVQSPFIED
jgi:rfaE bifunctional protein kinase chain/domain